MTLEQIDKRAEELFRECGGLPIEWGAVDECVRNHYRIMAQRSKFVPVVPADAALLVHQEKEDVAGSVP